LILCTRHLIADDKGTLRDAHANPLNEEITVSVLGPPASFEALVAAEGAGTRSGRAGVRAAGSDFAQHYQRPLRGPELATLWIRKGVKAAEVDMAWSLCGGAYLRGGTVGRIVESRQAAARQDLQSRGMASP